MRTESARGNVRGNKRPDFELHPRAKPADRRWRHIGDSRLGPNTTNLLISGSQVRVLGALPSPKEQTQASQEMPFGSMGRKLGVGAPRSGEGVACHSDLEERAGVSEETLHANSSLAAGFFLCLAGPRQAQFLSVHFAFSFSAAFPGTRRESARSIVDSRTEIPSTKGVL